MKDKWPPENAWVMKLKDNTILASLGAFKSANTACMLEVQKTSEDGTATGMLTMELFRDLIKPLSIFISTLQPCHITL